MNPRIKAQVRDKHGNLEEVDLGPASHPVPTGSFSHECEGRTYQHCYVEWEDEPQDDRSWRLFGLALIASCYWVIVAVTHLIASALR